MTDANVRWRSIQVRYLARNLDHLRIPKNAEERSHMPGDVPYWGANSIQGYVTQALVDGEIVLVGEDGAPFNDRLASVAFAIDYPIWPNNHVHVLRPIPTVEYRFLAAALNAVDYSRYIKGSTREKLNQSELSGIRLAIPSYERQVQIAEFLDRETAEIDAFIADQEELIGLLAERRAATISHAVTKGLDPTVPMKETGVAWFPVLPSTWDLMPVWLGAKLIQTGPFGSQLHSHEYVDGGIPLINPMHLVNGEIRHSSIVTVSETKAAELKRHWLLLGDIVVARRGELGRSAVVTESAVGSLCGTGSAIIRLDSRRFTPRYFQLVFSSKQTQAALLQFSIGSTMDNLNADVVGALRVPAPTVEEQASIVEYVEHETTKLDAAIADAKEAIALSRERRAALISAAVTGKIDVREHGAVA